VGESVGEGEGWMRVSVRVRVAGWVRVRVGGWLEVEGEDESVRVGR